MTKRKAKGRKGKKAHVEEANVKMLKALKQLVDLYRQLIDRALRRERERALEECRKKCKAIERKYNRPECGEYEYLKAHGAAECAEKIRAMREM